MSGPSSSLGSFLMPSSFISSASFCSSSFSPASIWTGQKLPLKNFIELIHRWKHFDPFFHLSSRPPGQLILNIPFSTRRWSIWRSEQKTSQGGRPRHLVASWSTKAGTQSTAASPFLLCLYDSPENNKCPELLYIFPILTFQYSISLAIDIMSTFN